MVDALTSGDRLGEARALLLLDALPGVGPATVRRLVDRFGSGRAAMAAPAPPFGRVAGASAAATRSDPAAAEEVERGLAVARRLEMTVLDWTDPSYPARLHRLADPPPVVFLRGRTELVGRSGVAVVGSRRATVRGRDLARQLGRALGARDVPVVSGLALGVDGAAHAGALEVGGPTVAVMGCGADRAYPRSHAALFRRVVAQGLVVSEFLPGTPVRPHHFPRRNRILAALAHTVVVVEARARSGALITVDHALDLGLDVFTVPGPIGTPTCSGSNGLLREGARPVLSVAEFVEAMAPPLEGGPGRKVPAILDEEAAAVLECLSEGARGVDGVARDTGLPPARTLALLTRLEVEGMAARLPGQRFRRAS